MSDKLFKGVMALIIVGTLGFGLSGMGGTKPPRPGVAHDDKGRKHVRGIESKPNEGAEPPTSGDHTSSPLQWQAYEQEIPDSGVVHNMEHGGIYISYRPDLPAEQISKLRALFFQPFSREKFTPSKAIMAPRPANEAAIILSSWTRSLKFDSFDEETMAEYYLRNVNKSPEPGAS